MPTGGARGRVTGSRIPSSCGSALDLAGAGDGVKCPCHAGGGRAWRPSGPNSGFPATRHRSFRAWPLWQAAPGAGRYRRPGFRRSYSWSAAFLSGRGMTFSRAISPNNGACVDFVAGRGASCTFRTSNGGRSCDDPGETARASALSFRGRWHDPQQCQAATGPLFRCTFGRPAGPIRRRHMRRCSQPMAGPTRGAMASTASCTSMPATMRCWASCAARRRCSSAATRAAPHGQGRRCRGVARRHRPSPPLGQRRSAGRGRVSALGVLRPAATRRDQPPGGAGAHRQVARPRKIRSTAAMAVATAVGT